MKRFFKILLFVTVIIFFICFSSLPNYAAEKVITLKYSGINPASHKHSVLSQQWCDEVEKRTNGRVKITFFPSATISAGVL
jgi:TRAP-type C4-dicarboxylate transport system substrate-binding protein